MAQAWRRWRTNDDLQLMQGFWGLTDEFEKPPLALFMQVLP